MKESKRVKKTVCAYCLNNKPVEETINIMAKSRHFERQHHSDMRTDKNFQFLLSSAYISILHFEVFRLYKQ